MQQRKDRIFWFTLDLTTIHPFGDGNGRVAVILLDLILAKHGFEPMNMHAIKERDYYGLRIAGEKTIKERDLKYMYEIIEKYSR